MRPISITALAFGLGCPLATGADDYARVFTDQLKRMVGHDLRQYEWFSYPTTNFGLGTMFVLERAGAKPRPENQWCTTYTCLGLTRLRQAATLQDRLQLSGFAETGEGGAITLTAQEGHQLATNILLPQIETKWVSP